MDYFTGQIVPFAIGYAPKFTALAAGQLLPVNQNMALFALFGQSFGGDGQPGGTFGLPNVAGRSLVGFGRGGSAMPLGATGGEANHTLTSGEMPQHTHPLNATNTGNPQTLPDGTLPGSISGGASIYGEAATLVPLGANPMSQAGSGQPHLNMQPSLALNFAVVLAGIYPSRG